MTLRKQFGVPGLVACLCTALVMATLRVPVALADTPVDLRGKRGIVDPNDLKKFDPVIPPAGATTPQENDWLREQIAELKSMRDKAIADIRKLQADIRKCDATIGKSENIVRLARRKNNQQAEAIANDAMAKAKDAKGKNEGMLEFRRLYKDLIEKRIRERENLLASMEKEKDHEQTQKETDCNKIAAQLERDKMVTARFMKTIDMSNKEREGWTKEGKDAVMEAGDVAVKYLTSGFSDMLEKRGGNLKKIEEQISKYEKRAVTGKDKYFIDLIKTKLKKAKWHYSEARNAFDTKIVVKSSDLINVLNGEYEVNRKRLEKGDQEVTEILKDTEIRGKLYDIGSFFTNALIDHETEIRKSSEYFKKAGPLLAGLSSAIDLSYAGLKFHYSLESIAQLGEVAEKELNAVNALKHQMERTMGRLKECRETAARNGK